MKKIGIFFAEGFEEIEALTVVDICRRCDLDIEMVSAYGEAQVLGSHGILVKMDKTFAEADFASYDMLVLPGGGKGTQGLEACAPLMEKIDEFYRVFLQRQVCKNHLHFDNFLHPTFDLLLHDDRVRLTDHKFCKMFP